ncbi:MAG: HAD family hydrolase [Candidatus Bathyarchaeota archaeon]|nr:HAD family hydrolase [Candidatus Bathyarchaeota archaeon]
MNSNSLNVKGIMLDLDGTILDTKSAYVETAKIAFHETGQGPPDVEAALEIPKRIEQRQPISDIIAVETSAFMRVYMKTFYKISALNTRPFPNVEATLAALSQKAQLAVITMRFVPGASVVNELRQFQLSQYFAHVVTALDTPKPKPSPEALMKAVAAMGVQMCECIIVGDSVVDVAAGKAAGATTVAVLTGLYSRAELEKAKPNFILNAVSELPPLINGA